MIQRVQTIFLFLITVAMGIALTNPLWEKGRYNTAGNGTSHRLTVHATTTVATQPGLPAQTLPATYGESVWYLALLIALVGLSAFYAIFQFKNRLTQTAMCAVNALMLTAIMGIILYRTLYAGKEYGNPADQGTFLTGFLCHYCGAGF